MDIWDLVPFGRDIRNAVDKKRRRKELDRTREAIQTGAQSALVKTRLEKRAEVDEKTGKVKPRFVELREETGYDYAAKCVKCGALMPINYTRSFMGKCVDCAEKKERAETLEFRQTMMKRFVWAALGGVLLMIVCGFLSKVMTLGGGFLKSLVEKYTEIKGLLYLIFVVMDFAMLADFVRSRSSAKSYSRIKKEISSLGYILLLVPDETDEYVVIFLGLVLVVAVLLRVRKYYKVKNYLKKYRMDTVAFKGRLLRDEEQKVKSAVKNAQTGEGKPEEGANPDLGGVPERQTLKNAVLGNESVAK